MSKYVYEGDSELIFPTLGLTVRKGDVFEAPEGLTTAGVVIAPAKGSKAASEPLKAADTVTDENVDDDITRGILNLPSQI